MFPWRLFGRCVLVSLCLIVGTLVIGGVLVPALWYHEWWPSIREEWRKR